MVLRMSSKDVNKAKVIMDYQIIKLDDGNAYSEGVVTKALDEIQAKYDILKKWLYHQKDEQQIDDKIVEFKMQCNKVYESAKKSMMDCANQECVQKTYLVAKSSASKVGHNICEQEQIAKGIVEISSIIQQINNDMRVKATVKKAKQTTLNGVSKAYECIKKVLEE